MKIALSQLPHDVQESTLQRALQRIAPVLSVHIFRGGRLPLAVVSVDASRVFADRISERINQHCKLGREVQAHVLLYQD